MNYEIQIKQSKERERCLNDIRKICDVKSSGGMKTTNFLHSRNTSLFIDHFRFFKTRRGQEFIYDDPYLKSTSIENEWRMKNLGFRILHLDPSMSAYIVGACQPRILIPPNSNANPEEIALQLELGQFKGNSTLTEYWRT